MFDSEDKQLIEDSFLEKYYSQSTAIFRVKGFHTKKAFASSSILLKLKKNIKLHLTKRGNKGSANTINSK